MGLLLVALASLASAGAAVWLRAGTVARRDPAEQAELDRAAAAIDRELAADLELMTMFDQTQQAFVLENDRFLALGGVLERAAPDAHRFVADVYGRVPETEAAMERRGPAGSIPAAERLVIEAWEGDAREAQRVLRAAVAPRRAARWRLLLERLRARRSAG